MSDFRLPSPLAEEQATLHQRFRQAVEDEGIDLNAISFDREHALDTLFAASPFIAETAIRFPQAFVDIVTDSHIEQPRTRADYAALIEQRLFADGVDPDTPALDSDGARRALRQIRQLEAARIGWRDIVLGVDVHTIMAELSAFADCVIESGVTWAQAALAPRFGRALNEAGEALSLGVVGMGKLGGEELNFSSDIDLIFVYQHAGTTSGGRKAIDFQDYFDRVGREFIGLLNDTTADGYVFRVDMRLRPFGDAGPLTCSLAALEHYYATHGRDWERYALIKARLITGDDACRRGFDALTRPFVYRRYLDYGALEALREMKRLINDEASAAGQALDIKRGHGGIREIEFTGQLFQLIRGGREPGLRTRRIIEALDTLSTLQLLDAGTVDELKTAYAFLRTTEHRLQQVRDWQTHSLPDSDVERERLRFTLGYDSWSTFAAAIDYQRERTRQHFNALLSENDADRPALEQWSRCWQQAAGAEPSASGAADDAVTEASTALKPAHQTVLKFVAQERFLSRLSREGRERLDRLMPLVLLEIETRDLPERAAADVASLITTIARRSVYVSFLADNPPALSRLFELFAASPWIAQQIIAQPLLLDELLDARQLYAPPQADELKTIAARQIDSNDGLEQAMDALRAFRNQQALRVAASDITDHLPVARVSDQLTWTAEACVERALALAWSELVARHGVPCCEDNGERRETGFAVVGYGKLGGIELGYSSDLDLVFLNDSSGSAQMTNGDKSVENNVFYTRLAQRFIHILSTTTASGTAYEVDTRLRPSGSAGMLVSPVDAYRRYLDDDAWVWEHQALVRARGIAGQANVLAAFEQTRRAVLSQPRDEVELAAAIVEMRQRMVAETDRGNDSLFDLKRGSGGMTDIEFMVQYAVLRWATQHDALLDWTDNLRLLETIAQLELLPAAACRQLIDAYFAFRAQIHRSALQQVDALVPVTEFADHRQAVQAIWTSVFEQGRGETT